MARKKKHKRQPQAGKKHHGPSPDTPKVVDKGLQELLFKDALQYSIFIVNQTYRRLCTDLLFLSRQLKNQDVPKDHFYGAQISAMACAWQVIDSVNRIRTLLNRGPRLMRIPTKDTECLLFLRQTAVVEDLRHTIQHLDDRLFDFVNLRLPALGSLNWLAKLDDGPGCETYTLVPGTIFDRLQPLIIPGRRMLPVGQIGVVTLISVTSANLTDIVEAQLPRLAEWLNKTTGVDCSQRGQGVMATAHWTPSAEPSNSEE